MSTHAYGSTPEQVGDLHLPGGPGPHPVVMLVHGGSFEAAYGRDMLDAAAQDLAGRGVAAWNVTYRRVGSGGGVPATADDGAAALSHLRRLPAALDLDDVHVLGFSAGFPVAVAAVRAAPVGVEVKGLVDLAGVTQLELGARLAGPRSGAWKLLGDPDAESDAYAAFDPIARPGLGVPSLAVHGDADALVPASFAQAWVDAARGAGDPAELRLVAGAGHFDLHVPGSEGWEAVTAWLARTD